MAKDPDLVPLQLFMKRVPAIRQKIDGGSSDNGWWIQFAIDVDDPLAWNVVQELAHVLNLLSLDERLPTVFKPVSPPPYLNGGPREFLHWTIECSDQEFAPQSAAKWLEARLPNPVDDKTRWSGLD